MGIEEMLKKGDGVRLGPGMSRRDFLKISGAGLAGTAMLAVPGCGVFSGSGGGGGGGGSSKAIAINLEQTIRDLDSADNHGLRLHGGTPECHVGPVQAGCERQALPGYGGKRGHQRVTGSTTRSPCATGSRGRTGTRLRLMTSSTPGSGL